MGDFVWFDPIGGAVVTDAESKARSADRYEDDEEPYTRERLYLHPRNFAVSWFAEGEEGANA